MDGEGFIGKPDPYKNTIEEFLLDNEFKLSENDGSVRPMPSQREHFGRIYNVLHKQNGNFSYISDDFSEENFYTYLDYLSYPHQYTGSHDSEYIQVSNFPLGISSYYYEFNKKKNATYLATEVFLPHEYGNFSSTNGVYMGLLEIKGLNENSRNLFYKELKERLNNRIPRNKTNF